MMSICKFVVLALLVVQTCAVESEANLKATSETHLKVTAEANSKVKSASNLKLKSEAHLKVELGAQSKAESEANLKIKSEAHLKVESGAKSKAKSETHLKVKSEAKAKVESQVSLKTKAKVELHASLQAESGAKMRLRFDEADAKKNRPVRKVINLLKEMKEALIQEKEDDEKNYDKMSCWCDLNEKRLVKQIADSENAVDEYRDEAEVLAALIAQLMTEIKNHKIDIAKWEKEIDQAHTLRRKQKDEFHEEEVDLMESTGALRAAVIVLEKHHQGKTLMQIPQDNVNMIAAAVKRGMDKHEPLLKAALNSSDREVVSSLIQMGGKRRTIRGKNKDHGKNPSYNTESSQIFGILETMLETYSTNLKAAQDEDAANEQAYRDLREAKEKQIAEAQDLVTRKKEELFNARMRLEEIKALIPFTKENREKDEAFLKAMRERCEIVEREWVVRQKTRGEEQEALTETITMLSSEDAHELLSRTFNPPKFLQEKSTTNSKEQLESTANSKARAQVSRLLSIVADKTHNPGIAMIAASATLDSFKRVEKAIMQMVSALNNQKAEETKVLEECKMLVKANEETMAQKKFAAKEAQDSIDELGVAMKEMKDFITVTKKEIKDLRAALKEAEKERAEEHAEFKQVIMDQTATQELLKKALKVLHEFYDRNLLPEIPKLVQTEYFPKKDAERSMPEDFGFDPYSKQTEEKEEGGVFQMINQIIYDSKATVKDAKREEKNAVDALEELKEDTANAVNPKTQSIIATTKNLAQAKVKMVALKQQLEDTLLEMEQLNNEKSHIDKECGFLFKNYEVRQSAIDDEVETLKKAHDILSGADFRTVKVL